MQSEETNQETKDPHRGKRAASHFSPVRFGVRIRRACAGGPNGSTRTRNPGPFRPRRARSHAAAKLSLALNPDPRRSGHHESNSEPESPSRSLVTALAYSDWPAGPGAEPSGRGSCLSPLPGPPGLRQRRAAPASGCGHCRVNCLAAGPFPGSGRVSPQAAASNPTPWHLTAGGRSEWSTGRRLRATAPGPAGPAHRRWRVSLPCH